MAASSFHPFPRLPTELRLQIWIGACVFDQPDDYGIHYIDVEPSFTQGIPSPSCTLIARLADGDKNSACLRDGGLWTACKESRDIMIRYSSVGGRDFVRINIRGNGKDWHSPVHPTHDIFCIKSKTWNSPDNHSEGWQIQIPDLNAQGLRTTNIRHIAFEFDESWNKDLPKCYYDLMSETSARGFLSRLLYNRFLNNSTTPQIWIIVKNGQWTVDLHQPGPTTSLNDYDTNYVPVSSYFSCRHCRRTHDFDGVFQSVRSFTYDLGDLGVACEKDHRNYKPTYDDVGDWGFEEQFNIASDLEFLAHRDMQIDLCTGRGPDEDEEDSDDFDLGF
ncbi:tetracycline resistance protein s [Fusarium sp. NRRL 52700]|nr:tetracycline resistance protein s [Fusarium sp. NRRL 52700]